MQVLASSLVSKDEWNLSNDEWKTRLSPESYYILREEGTERAFSSGLNNEKRNIFLLKPIYLNILFDDIEEIMANKKGSTQFVSRTLVTGDNIRLYS